MADHLDVFRGDVEILMPDTVIAANIWHWYLWDPDNNHPSDGACVTAIDNKLTAMYQDIQSLIATTVQVTDVIVNKVKWSVDKWITDYYVNTVSIGVTGTDATDPVPHGVAGLVTGYTDYPKVRGRKFFPGIGEDQFTGSTLVAGLVTLLTNLAVEWMSDYGLGGTTYLVGMVPTSTGLLAEIIRATIPGFASYQRRRKPGVGQ